MERLDRTKPWAGGWHVSLYLAGHGFQTIWPLETHPKQSLYRVK